MELLELTPSQLATFDFGRYFGMKTVGSDGMQKLLADLKPRLGGSLVCGGLAVVHHGYERYTKDADILYAYRNEANILRGLADKFKLIKKSKVGWHHFEHRETKIHLELVPEGILTNFGIIPGPHLFQSEDGFLPLWGLVWLKLVSGRAQDEADIVTLAKIRPADFPEMRSKLPSEYWERFDALMVRAQFERENDPNNSAAEDV